MALTSSPPAEDKAPDAAPLNEAEINRLISAARSESYRPSQTAPRPTVEAFRPKSLLELARLRSENEASEATPSPEEGMGDPAPSAPPDPVIETVGASSSIPDAEWDDLAPPGAPAQPEAAQSPEASAPPAAAPLESDGPGRAGGGVPAPDRSPAPDAAWIETIRAEAFAAGRAEAEAEAALRLTAATEVLEAVAQALQQPSADVLSALRGDITQAVLHLASERAGLEIDTIPEAFVDRIEELADRIHVRASQPVLRLHPDDLAAIEALIQGSENLSTMRILAAQDLSRGDVELSVDGLRLSDRIMGQPGGRGGARAASRKAPARE